LSASAPPPPAALARQARERFVADVEASLPDLAGAISTRLLEMVDRSPSTREAQIRRDALLQYERQRALWVDKTGRALRRASQRPDESRPVRSAAMGLELIGDDVVEQKIVASRLAMAIHEKVSWELNDLRVRIQALEGGNDFAADDVLRPEALALLLIEQWMDSDLSRQSWLMVSDLIQQRLVPVAGEAYRRVNGALIVAGVVPDVELSRRVKRSASAPSLRGPAGAEAAGVAGSQPAHLSSGGAVGAVSGIPGPAVAGAPAFFAAPAGVPGHGAPAPSPALAPSAANAGGGWGAGGASLAGGAGGAGSADGTGRAGGALPDDDRRHSADSPLLRARSRAQGLLGQLRRLLTERVAGFDPDRPLPASSALSHALTLQQSHLRTQVHERGTGGSDFGVYDDAAVQQVARELRVRTGELKQQAATSSEKAVIEIVALMFQSILAEERIPAGVRVWFARLQMPVLRLALAEPEFFGSLQHPARQLIDRMGSCVLGFDAAAIGGSTLEAEIRRVVQMIEQYPETGRRVFQLAFDEFQKFLSGYLTERGDTRRVVSVAQQVEQKETMAVRYTIELRKMLEDMPVRDEIRAFLFKVWAEVMALAAVKYGAQHADTLALKKSASELVWAASAKPNRAERALVIQGLPGLLQRLRQGMSLLGLEAAEQESHIKVIGDTLADAFQSKTAAISEASIEAIARRLANIEDFVGEDPEGDLPLVAESIEMMLGMDASGIDVISDGGSTPGAAMLAWARELQPGTWFTLDHNGQLYQVQYAWRSERGQLHLFAAVAGRSFLIQLRRLAAYLQAGLVVPAEEEALTVRATRDALAKIDANPERLFA
jgi:hypothetical protein